MPTFTTSRRDIARKFRTAYLTGQPINGDICGQSFREAEVCYVKRDPLSVAGRWRIRVKEAERQAAPDLTLIET